MDYIKLGVRIREERVKRHRSREKMAEDLSISASYVGQIERGEKCLTLDTLIDIANYYGLSVDYLLRDSLLASEMKTSDEWNQLTHGITVEEKQKLIDVVKASMKLIETR